MASEPSVCARVRSRSRKARSSVCLIAAARKNNPGEIVWMSRRLLPRPLLPRIEAFASCCPSESARFHEFADSKFYRPFRISFPRDCRVCSSLQWEVNLSGVHNYVALRDTAGSDVRFHRFTLRRARNLIFCIFHSFFFLLLFFRFFFFFVRRNIVALAYVTQAKLGTYKLDIFSKRIENKCFDFPVCIKKRVKKKLRESFFLSLEAGLRVNFLRKISFRPWAFAQTLWISAWASCAVQYF